MTPVAMARAMIASAADIIVLDDDAPSDAEVREFLVRYDVEAGAVFGAIATLCNEALGLLSDEQRVDFWRRVDMVVAKQEGK